MAINLIANCPWVPACDQSMVTSCECTFFNLRTTSSISIFSNTSCHDETISKALDYTTNIYCSMYRQHDCWRLLDTSCYFLRWYDPFFLVHDYLWSAKISIHNVIRNHHWMKFKLDISCCKIICKRALWVYGSMGWSFSLESRSFNYDQWVTMMDDKFKQTLLDQSNDHWIFPNITTHLNSLYICKLTMYVVILIIHLIDYTRNHNLWQWYAQCEDFVRLFHIFSYINPCYARN